MSPSISIKIIYIFGLIYLHLFLYVNSSFPYYGVKIGSLKELHHGVSGEVYAVDSRTLFIKKFNYDGEAPAAYFYVGNTNAPSNVGAHRLRDEKGDSATLTRRYRNKDITLTLPDNKTLKDIKWFSVWCDEFAVNFGDVTIPNNLDYPRPQKINGLNGVHGVKSDNIVIVDAQTLLIPNFSYDGEAPDAKFWVGQGEFPSSNGLRISDENGKETPLRRYDRKTIVLTLPDNLTIFDIGHFGVWCEAFTVDFGHVVIPKNLNVPPSLKMLGISPQSKLNCEVLHEDLAFEVRWAVAGESVVLQLVAKLENNEYMSFGISPEKNKSLMIGADVVVAWVDVESGKGFAQDYYLEDKSQCSGKRGSCPDVNILENSNSVRLLNAAMVNGYSIVTYQRSLNATDKLDLPISVSTPEAIVWAIGPLNERRETSFHTHYPKGTNLIHFGRAPAWKCPQPKGSHPFQSDIEDSDDPMLKPFEEDSEIYKSDEATSLSNGHHKGALALTHANDGDVQRLNQRHSVPTPKPVAETAAWEIPSIECYEPEDGIFYAQMGPTGGKHGYSAITGHVGWGISWYINGLLIPEIHVVRGKTYTFVVEGGNNPDIPAQFHPFYITDDPVGGYEHKFEEEKKNIRIFAGVHRSRANQVTPTGIGRLCNWVSDVDAPPADEYQSFGAYQRTLTLKCQPGEPGVITWKPDRNTPDIVYYHCFTHRFLGWKIHVHDSCYNPQTGTSHNQSAKVSESLPDEDLMGDTSVHHEQKIPFSDNSLSQQTHPIKNHNMNEAPPKLSFELTKTKEITKLISDGIRSTNTQKNSIIKQTSSLNRNEQVSDGKTINSSSSGNHSKYNVDAMADIGAYSNYLSISSVPQTGKDKSIISSSLALDLLHGETKPIHHQYSNILNNLQNIPTSYASNKSITHHSPNKHATNLPPHNHNHNLVNSLTPNLPSQNFFKVISLSDYLRPPFNAPLFHLIKVPGRRPLPGPTKKTPAIKPIFPHQLPRHPLLPSITGKIPESSILLSHYRQSKPVMLKPVQTKSKLNSPISPILILHDPTDVVNVRMSDARTHSKQNIQVPYDDINPINSINEPAFTNNLLEKIKKPNNTIKSVQALEVNKLKAASNVSRIASLDRQQSHGLSDVPEMPNNITLKKLAGLKLAVNEGFKPDAVIVEGGFRPILRGDGPPAFIEQIASRREDPDSEINLAMEMDTLFYKEIQTHHFEPIFVPSPTDSTHFVNIFQKPSDTVNLLQPHTQRLHQFNDLKTLQSALNSSKISVPNSVPESIATNTSQESLTNILSAANKLNVSENDNSIPLHDYFDKETKSQLINADEKASTNSIKALSPTTTTSVTIPHVIYLPGKLKNYNKLKLENTHHVNIFEANTDIIQDNLFDLEDSSYHSSSEKAGFHDSYQ